MGHLINLLLQQMLLASMPVLVLEALPLVLLLLLLTHISVELLHCQPCCLCELDQS